LPHLSTYLGHARLDDTQRYLTMTTELLEQASICFEQYARPEETHV
jgi:integrase/recombinase XerD